MNLVRLVPSTKYPLFRWSKMFSCGYFVRPKILLVAVLCVQFFFRVAYFMIQRFSFVGCMRKSDRKQKYINTFQTVSSISNRFQKLSVLLILEKYPREKVLCSRNTHEKKLRIHEIHTRKNFGPMKFSARNNFKSTKTQWHDNSRHTIPRMA